MSRRPTLYVEQGILTQLADARFCSRNMDHIWSAMRTGAGMAPPPTDLSSRRPELERMSEPPGVRDPPPPGDSSPPPTPPSRADMPPVRASAAASARPSSNSDGGAKNTGRPSRSAAANLADSALKYISEMRASMSHTVTTVRSQQRGPNVASRSSAAAAVCTAQLVLLLLPGTSPSSPPGWTAYMTRANERPHLRVSSSPTAAALSSLDSSASRIT